MRANAPSASANSDSRPSGRNSGSSRRLFSAGGASAYRRATSSGTGRAEASLAAWFAPVLDDIACLVMAASSF
jgi:hypothetical protein